MNLSGAIAVMLTASCAAAAFATPTSDVPDISPTPFPDFQPKAQQKPPAIVSPMPAVEAVAVLGKKVLGPDDKGVVGQIVDILIDKDGKPTAAVIDVGGFLGVGSRKIAVDWKSLKFKPGNQDAPVSLTLDREQVQSAPEYKESGSVTAVVVTPAQPEQSNAPD